MNDDDLKTVETMRTYGGSFVKALAECALHADPNNLMKLKETFTGYFDEYELMWRKETEAKKKYDPKTKKTI